VCRALRDPISLCRLKATVSRGGTYEPVTPSRNRLDATSFRTITVQHAAERRDLNGEIGFLDHDARPDGGHDFILRDEVARPLDHNTEHVERTGAEFNGRGIATLGASEQSAAAPVEAELAEHNSIGRAGHVHVWASARSGWERQGVQKV
jgi:hypothetical protein